uniref:Uncharacterized protein n=1 Tax=Parascaris equorum TaxID=6256 RepID=A0A914RLW0_PAREQ
MVGTYEQQIGYAFYLHLMGTVCWILAFVVALLTTYKFFTDRYSPSSLVTSKQIQSFVLLSLRFHLRFCNYRANVIIRTRSDYSAPFFF